MLRHLLQMDEILINIIIRTRYLTNISKSINVTMLLCYYVHFQQSVSLYLTDASDTCISR